MLYFKNPAFIAYIHNLVDLHALIVRELDDSPEAEAIRDQTDPLWPNLTDEERTELRRISEFLYWIKDGNVYTTTEKEKEHNHRENKTN